jgi:hypothetical protein
VKDQLLIAVGPANFTPLNKEKQKPVVIIEGDKTSPNE